MSRWTTSSSNLRPMRRLMANNVFCGLVTAWRLAGWPTSTSLSFVKATIDGVVRSPSLFSITRGLPPSMMATHELVVPRSMPITFAMCLLRRNLFQKGDDVDALLGYPPSFFKAPDRGGARSLGRRLGHDDPGGPHHPPVELVAGLHDLQHRVRLRAVGGLGQHRLVPARVEGLAHGVDGHYAEALQRLDEQ